MGCGCNTKESVREKENIPNNQAQEQNPKVINVQKSNEPPAQQNQKPIQTDVKEDISKKLLFLKIFNENKEFHPIILGKYKNVYLIGRSKDSDIIIEDNFLSKINCFLYNNNSNWNIQDGDQNGIKSTNGTWLYASEDFEIFDDMVFRSNNYNFYCKFSSNL